VCKGPEVEHNVGSAVALLPAVIALAVNEVSVAKIVMKVDSAFDKDQCRHVG
jgi:hypothetical protein